MEFRTNIHPLDDHIGLIDHSSPILFLGSCFADSVGALMSRQLFDTVVNPFGPLYNPLSIETLVDRMVCGPAFSENDIFESSPGRYSCWLCHTKLTASSPDMIIGQLNNRLRDCRTLLLQKSPIIAITLGSAWVYRLLESGQVVANCHKQPTRMFDHSMLSVGDATDALHRTIGRILSIAPGANIILTVSPIRHTAYGLHGNQLSKSTLLLAENAICANPDMRSIYFPSYEAMMDDLRDYRFYAADMKHPSDLAVNYIYDLFSSSFLTEKTRLIAGKAESYTRRLCHRPSSSDTNAYSRFLADTDRIGEELLSEYSGLNRAFSKYKLSHLPK